MGARPNQDIFDKRTRADGRAENGVSSNEFTKLKPFNESMDLCHFWVRSSTGWARPMQTAAIPESRFRVAQCPATHRSA